MSDSFSLKALFGMKNVGVSKSWKCLFVHNKLDAVGPPSPLDKLFTPTLILFSVYTSCFISFMVLRRLVRQVYSC